MRVLHIIPSLNPLNGGPNEALRRYARVMEGDIAMEIATSTEGLTHPAQGELQKSYGECRVRFFRNIGAHSQNLAFGMYVWLWRNCREYDVVHLHACFSPTTTIAALICQHRGVPYIIMPHDTISVYGVQSGHASLKRLYLRVLENKVLENAAALHFTADDEPLNLLPSIKFKDHAVVPIPYLKQDEPPSRMLSGVHERRRDILFLSRIHPKKGLEVLIAAFRQLIERHPLAARDYRLVIAGVGDPVYEDSLKGISRDLERSGRIVWSGFVQGEQKNALLSESMIFCLPSYHENFGVAVMEAMVAGLPVIVSDQVAIFKDILKFNAGLIVPSGNAMELTAAITDLIQDPDKMATLAANAKRLVIEKYGESAVRTSMLRLYEKVLRKDSP